jgi:hypothetical protein
MKKGFSHNILPGSFKGEFMIVAVPRHHNIEYAEVIDGYYCPGSQEMAREVSEFWADTAPHREVLLVKVIGSWKSETEETTEIDRQFYEQCAAHRSGARRLSRAELDRAFGAATKET